LHIENYFVYEVECFTNFYVFVAGDCAQQRRVLHVSERP